MSAQNSYKNYICGKKQDVFIRCIISLINSLKKNTRLMLIGLKLLGIQIKL